MPGSTVWGREYGSGALANTSVYQPLRPNRNIILKAVRTWLIFYKNPVVENFTMKMYSDRTDTLTHEPGKLLHTSTNILTKSEIITLDNGFKEVFFTFDEINLEENTWYNFVINAGTYTPAGGSHVSWRIGFPDPVYTTNLVISPDDLTNMPILLYLIGDDL